MYMEISKAYSNYIKYYMNTCLKTDMLTKPRKKLSDEVRTLRTADILRNYEFFEGTHIAEARYAAWGYAWVKGLSLSKAACQFLSAYGTYARAKTCMDMSHTE